MKLNRNEKNVTIGDDCLFAWCLALEKGSLCIQVGYGIGVGRAIAMRMLTTLRVVDFLMDQYAICSMNFDLVMMRRIQDMTTTSGQRIFSKNSDPGTSRMLLSRKEGL